MKGDRQMKSPESDARSEHPERPAQRKPYVKPAYCRESIVRTYALSCNSHTGSCSTKF